MTACAAGSCFTLSMLAFALAGLVAVPASVKADVPTVDSETLDLREQHDRAVGKLEDTDHDRYIMNASVTCSMYRPAHRNDPVGAARANPEIAGLVRRIAREEDVNENEFLALVYQESRFNPCARSTAGATGLAQLMPETAAAAITKDWLPAFGGADKSAIPLNFGGGETAFSNMRSSTLLAMGTTASTSASLDGVASWYRQFGAVQTGTQQQSFDYNSAARSANLEMMNHIIKLTTAMAELINSRNSVASADLTGASRSSGVGQRQARDTIALCDPRQDLVWSAKAKACVKKRSDVSQVQLLLQPL